MLLEYSDGKLTERFDIQTAPPASPDFRIGSGLYLPNPLVSAFAESGDEIITEFLNIQN